MCKFLAIHEVNLTRLVWCWPISVCIVCVRDSSQPWAGNFQIVETSNEGVGVTQKFWGDSSTGFTKPKFQNSASYFLSRIPCSFLPRVTETDFPSSIGATGRTRSKICIVNFPHGCRAQLLKPFRTSAQKQAVELGTTERSTNEKRRERWNKTSTFFPLNFFFLALVQRRFLLHLSRCGVCLPRVCSFQINRVA